MKSHHPILQFFLTINLALLYPSGVMARGDCASCQSDCHGKIILFNPDNGKTLSADVKAFMEKSTAAGAPPVSCIRPQHCQDQLYHCYNSCGQEGRAARHSTHTDGTACDFSKAHKGTLKSMRRAFPNIQEYVHGEFGAGLHDHTVRYVASSGGTTVRPTPATPPVKKPSVPAQPQREPSSGGDTEQFANGRYKCAAGMKSICGSTRDTAWCKRWIEAGNTPGCHN